MAATQSSITVWVRELLHHGDEKFGFNTQFEVSLTDTFAYIRLQIAKEIKKYWNLDMSIHYIERNVTLFYNQSSLGADINPMTIQELFDTRRFMGDILLITIEFSHIIESIINQADSHLVTSLKDHDPNNNYYVSVTVDTPDDTADVGFFVSIAQNVVVQDIVNMALRQTWMLIGYPIVEESISLYNIKLNAQTKMNELYLIPEIEAARLRTMGEGFYLHFIIEAYRMGG